MARVRRVTMSLRLIHLLFFAALIGLSRQASKPEDSFYIAGVVEFSPAAMNQSSQAQVDDNLRGYLDILMSPEAESTDIVVFPELTLNNVLQLTFVPDPENAVVPCGNTVYQPFLQELSCAARDIGKYVVINVLEKETCTVDSQASKKDPRPCALNGLSTFNTNVVFDRKGAVVARYRKYNVYGEPRNVTYEPEMSTFVTDFGVKFGQFICFDINFYSPAMDLVNSGVKDFIYSSFWYSELPFLTAVQLHQSWAWANNVNLLAAGASYPVYGSTGSGIYAGERGTLVSVMATAPERKLYVANVTKFSHFSKVSASQKTATQARETPKKRSLGELSLMQEYKLPEFVSVPLKLDQPDVTQTVCYGDFCCLFNFKLNKLTPPSGSSSYQYQMAAYDGGRQYSGNGYTRYKVCAVYACTSASRDSCGKVFGNDVTVSPEFSFTYMSIEANFTRMEKALYLPNSVDQDLQPLPVEFSEFVRINDKNTHVSYVYKNETSNLLTFGIYANLFTSAGHQKVISLAALFLPFLVMLCVKICSL